MLKLFIISRPGDYLKTIPEDMLFRQTELSWTHVYIGVLAV